MKLRNFLAFAAVAAITLVEAATVKPFILKTEPPSGNVILRVKDAGNNQYGVFGNANVNGINEPYSAKLSRYLVGTPSGFTELVGDVVHGFMDYTDDSCMSFQTTLPNGRQGIGVARYRPNGTMVYRTTREINSFAGFERIVGSGVDGSGAIYILGESQNSATTSSAFLAKFNPNGSVGWMRTWYQHKPIGLSVFLDGTVLVDKMGNFEIQGLRINPAGANLGSSVLSQGQVNPAGTISRYAEYEEISFVYHTITWTLMDGTVHSALRRMNCQDGMVNWLHDFSIPNGEVRGTSLSRTSTDDVVLTAVRKYTQTGLTDIAIFKLDSNGNQLWDRSLPINPNTLEKPNNITAMDDWNELYVVTSGDSGKSHLTKYAPNGTKRWDMIFPTPGENVTQAATLVSMTDILISSYSFGATQTGSFRMQTFQQSAVALNDNYNINKNVVNTPSRPVVQNDRYALGATIAVTQQPMHGTVQMFSNGVFRYTPEAGYVGPDSFKYTLSKPSLDPSVAQVGLNVK